MDRRESEALDRHITGNYGEDQFADTSGHTCRWIGTGLDGAHYECMHDESMALCVLPAEPTDDDESDWDPTPEEENR